jgi:Pentapeptide repeats (9 copies)
LQGADFGQAQLQGASLARAQLQGANFMLSQLQGANLDQAQLQGALLLQAHLEGASLNLAQLQGANLTAAQLQFASLDGAQLQGANLQLAQLQGANLNNTQLQGAWLARPPPFEHFGDEARLDGASLRHTYVWRTYPPADPNGVVVSAPEAGPKYVSLDCPAGECDWSDKSYAALKSLIESSVPLRSRNEALRQIATLEKPPYVADEVATEAWTNLAKEGARSSASFNIMTKTLEEIGCAADGAPYVIGSLMRRISLMGEVAAAFLDESKCPGARGLSEENKAKLREIRDRGLPAPAGPAAAAR